MPKSKELMELIAFQAPRALKEKLEAYCKTTGYNMSYAIRKAVEDQILTPKLTWEDLAEWKDWVNKTLGDLAQNQRKAWELTQKDIAKIYEVLESNGKVLEALARIVEKHDLQLQFQSEFLEILAEKVILGRPISEERLRALDKLLTEAKELKRKET